MKLPIEIELIGTRTSKDRLRRDESIVRDCAKVCESLETDMGHGLPQQCADAILARYGLEDK